MIPMNTEVVGKCSNCGGLVCVPVVWHGVNKPPATCQDCGAVEDISANLPVIPTIKEEGGNAQRFLQD